MALFYSSSLISALNTTVSVPKVVYLDSPIKSSTYHTGNVLAITEKWRAKASRFSAFFVKGKDANSIKEELLEAIAPLDGGADATPEDQKIVDRRPKFLRSVANYQAINIDTLRAQNMESWPFFNQVTANLTPLNARKVAVQFDFFKVAGFIPVKAPATARAELETTYLDEELRVSRGSQGNLFILKMVDPSYRVPV